MVRPASFGWNAQTDASNRFQLAAPVTADDVVFTANYCMNPDGGCGSSPASASGMLPWLQAAPTVALLPATCRGRRGGGALVS
jgi:ABC-type transport system substrate-binding protein